MPGVVCFAFSSFIEEHAAKLWSVTPRVNNQRAQAAPLRAEPVGENGSGANCIHFEYVYDPITNDATWSRTYSSGASAAVAGRSGALRFVKMRLL